AWHCVDVAIRTHVFGNRVLEEGELYRSHGSSAGRRRDGDADRDGLSVGGSSRTAFGHTRRCLGDYTRCIGYQADRIVAAGVPVVDRERGHRQSLPRTYVRRVIDFGEAGYSVPGFQA